MAHADHAQPLEIVVDTPKGSRNKYKHDERRDVFVLHKLLPEGLPFPFDFGFVPGTRGEDGDALDVLVIHAEATFVGCRIPVRVLGVLQAEQTEKSGETVRNDRVVAVPETEKIRPRERRLEDLPAGLLDAIERFFVTYNEAEGRRFRVLGRGGPAEATRLVAEGRSAATPKKRSARARPKGASRRSKSAR
jgi:inorganic pyrophosphatase